MIAPLFGMVSAFVGNVVRFWKPWSQLTPTAVGIIVIAYFMIQIYRRRTPDFGPAS
jgi:hypothetical protein